MQSKKEVWLFRPASDAGFAMSRKKVRLKTKGTKASADLGLPNFLIAAGFGAAIIHYSEFVFNAARDSDDHTADLPLWRVHMGSACLGTLAFIVVLFCLEMLECKSTNLALWSAVKWLPLVGLTGTATFVHIPFMIVLALAVLYGGWVYRQVHLERRRAE